MKNEEESTSEFSSFNIFVTFVSYLKEYGRAETDIIVEAG